MAKIKLGNVKGPKGDQGVRGSKWFNTANITGTSTSGTAFPNSGIASAMVGDMALNPTTLNLYICQTAGNAATAKWAFIACIKGPQGAKGDKGDPTTVDAVLSKDSTNPIQNKAVATKFQDVQDSLGQIFQTEGKGVLNDLNDAPFGVYPYAESFGSKNTPTGYGVVMTLGNNGDPESTLWWFQIAFGTNNRVYTRGMINQPGIWSEWAQL